MADRYIEILKKKQKFANIFKNGASYLSLLFLREIKGNSKIPMSIIELRFPLLNTSPRACKLFHANYRRVRANMYRE